MEQAAREAAGRAVLRQMSRQKLSRTDVIRASGVDNKTLQALLEGQRWPQVLTRARIEEAIGWQPGDIERAARGELAEASEETRRAQHLSDAELIAELALRLGRRGAERAGTREGDGHGQQPAPIDDSDDPGGLVADLHQLDADARRRAAARRGDLPEDVAARDTGKKSRVQLAREQQDQDAED